MADNFTFDSKKHAYTLEGKPMMGVTSVLSIIAKPALVGWSAKMVCEYIKNNCLVTHIPETELNGYIVSEEDLVKAQVHHVRKKENAGQKGNDTHAEIEGYVKYCIKHSDGWAKPESEDDMYDVDGSAGLKSFILWATLNNIKFRDSEKRMYSKEWWVAGTADLFFEKDGKTYCGDIKTMKKLWDNTPFIQCAAYSKMIFESEGTKIDGVCIINIPKETNQVETFYRYDLEGDTKAFEAALTLYKAVNN